MIGAWDACTESPICAGVVSGIIVWGLQNAVPAALGGREAEVPELISPAGRAPRLPELSLGPDAGRSQRRRSTRLPW
jgi:hypothetical protein